MKNIDVYEMTETVVIELNSDTPHCRQFKVQLLSEWGLEISKRPHSIIKSVFFDDAEMNRDTPSVGIPPSVYGRVRKYSL